MLCRAVLALWGDSTDVVRSANGRMQIVSLSPMRICCFLLLQASRLVIAVALLLGGARFLVRNL